MPNRWTENSIAGSTMGTVNSETLLVEIECESFLIVIPTMN
jgi:hypothetical protein